MTSAAKWSPKKSISIAGTKMRTRDCYPVHEREHLFCYIVGGVVAPVCGVLPSSTRIVHIHKGVSYEEQIARVLPSILTCSIPPPARRGRMDAAAQSEQYETWNSICSTECTPPGLNNRCLSS